MLLHCGCYDVEELSVLVGLVRQIDGQDHEQSEGPQPRFLKRSSVIVPYTTGCSGWGRGRGPPQHYNLREFVKLT
jgi:hypothetical protein